MGLLCYAELFGTNPGGESVFLNETRPSLCQLTTAGALNDVQLHKEYGGMHLPQRHLQQPGRGGSALHRGYEARAGAAEGQQRHIRVPRHPQAAEHHTPSITSATPSAHTHPLNAPDATYTSPVKA